MDVFDIYQQGQINDAVQSAARAQNKADQFSQQITVLTRRVDRLSLACQALWELLRESGHYTEEHLIHKMEQVDVRDGSADGKMTATVKVCPRCQRNSNSKRLECVYCGEPLPAPNLFDAR